MERVVDSQFRDVELEGRWDLGGKGLDGDLVAGRNEDSSFLDSYRAADEVDGDLGMDFHGEVNTNEIDVTDEGLIGMAIDSSDQGRNPLGSVDLEVDHDICSGRGVKGLSEIVVIDCEHMCMAVRGIRKPGARTVTSAVRGILQRDPRTRAEAMSLILGRP